MWNPTTQLEINEDKIFRWKWIEAYYYTTSKEINEFIDMILWLENMPQTMIRIIRWVKYQIEKFFDLCKD